MPVSLVLDESLFIVTPTTINVLNGRPFKGRSVPHAPKPTADGRLLFPLNLDAEWLASHEAKKGISEALFSDEKHALYLQWLSFPTSKPGGTDSASRQEQVNIKNRATTEYKLGSPGFFYR